MTTEISAPAYEIDVTGLSVTQAMEVFHHAMATLYEGRPATEYGESRITQVIQGHALRPGDRIMIRMVSTISANDMVSVGAVIVPAGEKALSELPNPFKLLKPVSVVRWELEEEKYVTVGGKMYTESEVEAALQLLRAAGGE